MSNTLLDQTRMLHFDIDSLEQKAVEKMNNPPKTHREGIYNDHRIKSSVQQIIEKSKQLQDIYNDESGIRKDEIAGMGGMNALSVFYDRLKEIRELHRLGPDDMAGVTRTSAYDEEEPVEFSGPEGYGRYLDLYSFHQRSLNMEQFEKSDYLNYLRIFYKFDRVQKEKKNGAYQSYLQDMFNYLYHYTERVQPLLDAAADLEKTDKDFEEAWQQGTVTGWTKEDANLQSNPLYCTACQHLFAKQVTFDNHLTGKRHVRAAKESAATPKASGDAQRVKAIAQLEFRITHLIKVLSAKVEGSISHIQKKLASTYEELEADINDMENEYEPVEEKEEESDDEDKPIYNPLNLPLGWDGKPIPYWLWKLHGLGIEYKCEICGNHSYWGPRNFERHFQEFRHQHGMRCLKIPNSKHFQDITQIEDAYALYEKLKKEGAMKEWNPDKEEELEDYDGHVYSKKMYDDLRRQGLISLRT